MPRKNREIVAPDGVSVTLHCYSRCVRRTFLCGVDQETGVNYEHRKQWIRDRLEFLASVFAIDILGFAVMDNHFHLICRTRHDISDTWSDTEVARRWYRLFPKRRDENGSPAQPTDTEVEELLIHKSQGDPAKRAAELRRRLQNVSWLMKSVCETISRKSNQEDNLSGTFWEGRFKAQKLLDDQAILACSVYVDLNPVRAAKAESPEASRYTSVYERIAARQAQPGPSPAAGKPNTGKSNTGRPNRRPRESASAGGDRFLVPLTLPAKYDRDASGKEDRLMACPQHYRASDKGFLRMTLDKYLELLDWTGRQIRGDKRGSIPASLAPILERLEISDETWVDCIKNFGRWFGWAVGQEKALTGERDRIGHHRIRGRSQAASVFG